MNLLKQIHQINDYMKTVDVEEFKNKIDEYIKIARTEEIKITSKGKPIFTIVPNNSELIKRWESIIGTLPKEALEAFDNKEIDRK